MDDKGLVALTKKVKNAKIDLCTNVLAIKDEMLMFMQKGFDDIEAKNVKNLEKTRRQIKDMMHIELITETKGPGFDALNRKIEVLSVPLGTDDYVKSDVDQIRIEIADYLVALVSEHLTHTRQSFVQAKDKIQKQLYTTRDSTEAFKKSYDVSARLREETLLRNEVNYHEKRYSEDTTAMQEQINQLEYTVKLMTNSISNLREELVNAQEEVVIKTDRISMLQLTIEKQATSKKGGKGGSNAAHLLLHLSGNTARSTPIVDSKPSSPAVKPTGPTQPAAPSIPESCDKCQKHEEQIKWWEERMDESEQALAKATEELRVAGDIANDNLNEKLKIESLFETAEESLAGKTEELENRVEECEGLRTILKEKENALSDANAHLTELTDHLHSVKSNADSLHKHHESKAGQLLQLDEENAALYQRVEELLLTVQQYKEQVVVLQAEKTVLMAGQAAGVTILPEQPTAAPLPLEADEPSIGTAIGMDTSVGFSHDPSPDPSVLDAMKQEEDKEGRKAEGLDSGGSLDSGKKGPIVSGIASHLEDGEGDGEMKEDWPSPSNSPFVLSRANSASSFIDSSAEASRCNSPMNDSASPGQREMEAVHRRPPHKFILLRNPNSTKGILGGPSSANNSARNSSAGSKPTSSRGPTRGEEEEEEEEEAHAPTPNTANTLDSRGGNPPPAQDQVNVHGPHTGQHMVAGPAGPTQGMVPFTSPVSNDGGFRHTPHVFSNDDDEDDFHPQQYAQLTQPTMSIRDSNNKEVNSEPVVVAPLQPAVQVRRLSENLANDHNTIAMAMRIFNVNEELKKSIDALQKENKELMKKIRHDELERQKAETLLNLKLKERSILLQELSEQVHNLRKDLKEARDTKAATVVDVQNYYSSDYGESQFLPRLTKIDLSKSFNGTCYADTLTKSLPRNKMYKKHGEGIGSRGKTAQPMPRTASAQMMIDKSSDNRLVYHMTREISDEKIIELRNLREQIHELSRSQRLRSPLRMANRIDTEDELSQNSR